MNIVVESRPFARVPQVHLVGSVAGLAHVHNLKARIDGFQALAPGAVVIHAVPECERVPGTDDPKLSFGDCPREFLVRSISLRVDSQGDTWRIIVFLRKVWDADPSQLRVILHRMRGER